MIPQDQLILSWILTGVSSKILPQIAAFKTSAEAWDCLCWLYSSSTQTRQLHLRFPLPSIRKSNLSMENYILRISVWKDALVATGEKLKDSKSSFVTSIMTWFDHTMTFSTLCELLLDHEMRQIGRNLMTELCGNRSTWYWNQVKIGTTCWNEEKRENSGKGASCQIYGCKNHTMINCYQHRNLSRYMPSHRRELLYTGYVSIPNKNSTNLASGSGETMALWYPNTGSTFHVTSDPENIQRSRIFHESVGSPHNH